MSRYRRLFYAIDGTGEKYHIDHLKTKKETLLCPHCRTPVIAKQGEEKIWHFAHVGELCSALKKIDADKEDEKLFRFQTEEAGKIEVGDSTTYLCPHCKKVGNKVFAVKLDSGYICKECYLHR